MLHKNTARRLAELQEFSPPLTLQNATETCAVAATAWFGSKSEARGPSRCLPSHERMRRSRSIWTTAQQVQRPCCPVRQKRIRWLRLRSKWLDNLYAMRRRVRTLGKVNSRG